ncbi:MAG TPA: hypothetical protein VIF57_19380 [Polyangia bacterium]|jgi:hypothetical protein
MSRLLLAALLVSAAAARAVAEPGERDRIREARPGFAAVERLTKLAADDKRAEQNALAALAGYRDKGVLSARNFEELDAASRDQQHASLTVVFEDALAVLKQGRVQAGTELSIYAREAVSAERGEPPPESGERAADLAFADARGDRRVIRFAPMSLLMLRYRIGNGEVGNALAWVAEKPDARSLEVAFESTDMFPGYLLLIDDTMKEVEAKVGTRMPRGLARRPLLVQGGTAISYERWLALAARFRARRLDKADFLRDRRLAKMVTLADLVRALGGR